jgi:hypothetical protein
MPSKSLLGFQNFTTNNDISYKHRIVCYLLSHINACSSEFVQTKLLNCIAAIPDKAKSQILLPTIQVLTEKATATQPADIFAASSERLTIQLLSCFDTAAAHLNENPSAWNLFLLVIRTYLRYGGVISSILSFSSLSPLIYLRNAAVCSTSTCTCRSEWFVLVLKPTTENCGL